MTIRLRDRPDTDRGREYRIVLALAYAGLTASFMQTLVTPIQAQLPQLLGAPRDQTAWVFTVTLVAAGVATPIAGRLGDLYGRRRIAAALLIALVVGSLMCATAPDLSLLLVGRALQGAVMGVIPLGISILSSRLPAHRVTTGIAIMSATMGIGAGLGLPASAALAQYGGWRWLFWVSAAMAVAAWLVIMLLVPPTPATKTEPFDLIGAVTFAGTLSAVLLALAQGGAWGWGSPLTGSVGGAAAAFAVGWWAHERRSAHPLIHLDLLVHRPVLLTNLASFAMAVSLFASSVTFPQVLTLPDTAPLGYGLTLLESSWIMLPSGIMMMLLAPFARRLIVRFGAQTVLGFGGGFLALAYVWTLLPSPTPLHLFIANIVIGVGVGVGFAAMPTLILAAVPAERVGEANGINALARSLGSSSASAVGGATLAAGVHVGQGPTEAAFRAVWLMGSIAGLVCFIIGCAARGGRASQRG